MTRLLGVGLLGLAASGLAAARRVLRVVERPSWPPRADATTAAGAKNATEVFLAGSPRPRDTGLPFAWTTAATIEPWPDGRQFYPRIEADLEAAKSSIHILMFGWKPGEVGDRIAEILRRKLDAGVEVRILVDSSGSRPSGLSAEMFRRLASAGALIAVNDLLPPDRKGTLPQRGLDWRYSETGRADHRKLIVIDGAVIWTGGAGIEDHFMNGEFHDIMVRVTGDIVHQAQAVFLTSFASHGAAVPPDLTPYFPAQPGGGQIPAALVQVVPGGFVAATQSLREMIDRAEHRLDIMNPYLTDRSFIEQIIAAARRGVAVRIVLSQNSNNHLASAATWHRYRDLIEAGVSIVEYPGAVVHAKVAIADDHVHFGTLNLDAWALYRDFEIAIVARGTEVCEQFERRLFEPDIARSSIGAAPSSLADRTLAQLADRLTFFL